MSSTLEPGLETERCKFFKVPPGGYYVNREEIRYTPGSHHVLLYKTPYTEIPTQDEFGSPVDTSGVFECGAQGATGHWKVDGVAGGAQTASGPAIIKSLPANTAVVFTEGTVLLMNTHYLNASAKKLDTDARINLWTVPAAQVTQEAGVVFFYNPLIRVPSRGQAQAREVCPVLSEITLVNGQSHMHKRGVDYVSNLLDNSGNMMDTLYQTTEWAEVVAREFEPGMTLKPGQLIDYRCGYSNSEDRVIMQGPTTKDEMCMFTGLYYPRNRQFELCGINDKWEGGFLGATWVGNGTHDGDATLDCMKNSKDTNEDHGESYVGCILDACPKVSTLVSNLARCHLTNAYGKCQMQCADKMNVKPCRQCVTDSCDADAKPLSGAKCQ